MCLHRTIVFPQLVICACALILFSLILAEVPALAVTVPYTLTGTIDSSDPVFDNDKVLLDCTIVWSGTNWHYEIRTLTVDKSISLNIRDLHNTDAMNVIYGVYDVTTTPFNASNLPLTSQCIGAATNNLNVLLEPGRTYALVIANAVSAAGGNYEVELTSTDTSVNLIIGDPGGSPPAPATITSITSTAVDGNYGPGATISIQVNFSKPVTYTSIGTYMSLALNNGVNAICTYCNAYPTALSSTYTFTYEVDFGQAIAELDVASTTALSLAGGTLQDEGGTIVDITLPVGADAGSLSSNKNLAIVTPSLSINNATVTEGDTGTVTAEFTITMSVALTAPTVTVNYTTVNGTATAGTDYIATNGTLTFAPGTTTQTVTVTVNGDTLHEANETFRVALSGATNASVATANGTGTIMNDDPAPNLSINDATVTEGNAGTVNATFTVTLSFVSGQTITVDYTTANGTATAGADYIAANGTLTFNPGETTQTINVAVNGDTLNEINETFTVVLSGANVTIATANGTGTITDDDPVPSLSIGDTAVTEGNAGTTVATFMVTLSAASGQTVTVDYATADGTAIAGVDYTAVSGTLTFAPGVATQTISVDVIGDGAFENDETFMVTLSAPTNATIATATGTGTITNDDIIPSISINDVSVVEGNTGTSSAVFTLSLSAPSNQTITVDVSTANGTAIVGDDYLALTSTVTFAPGSVSQTVSVTINGDTLNEPDETYFINLTNAVNATIADNQGLGTITNDDAAPGLSVNDVSLTEGDAGTSVMTFTVTLSPASGQTVTVNYATTDGTATAGSDYVAASGNLTFMPGVTTHTVSVTVNGDTVLEADETFTLDLNTAVNAVIDDGQGVGTILNDEPLPGLTVNDLTISETAGSSQFTITLSPASIVAVSVDYTITDGTARQGVDYTAAALTGTVNFAPGDTVVTIPFTLIDNAIADGSRAFTITLSNSSSVAIVKSIGVATILDNESPVIELPAPPPATACSDVNFEQNGAIRSNFTNSADTAALHCRLIAVDGQYMTWYGSPLTSNGNIGESFVLILGVVAAVDVFSMNGSAGFVGDVNVCLKGSGYIIYLNANGAPRVPQLWSSWTTPAFPGYTCTTLYAPGTVVLVQRQP